MLGVIFEREGVIVSVILFEMLVDNYESFDDIYRCIVSFNINLLLQVYMDKFEWLLLYLLGMVEFFVKQICSDLGLFGEWVLVMMYVIYEVVLCFKKEVCELGGLVVGWVGVLFVFIVSGGVLFLGGVIEFLNDVVNFSGVGVGWCYDFDGFVEFWGFCLEYFSKEEIEKWEGDWECQICWLRREIVCFSSNIGLGVGGVFVGFGFIGFIE